MAALDLRSLSFRTGNLVVAGSGVAQGRLLSLLAQHGGGLQEAPRLSPVASPYQGGEVRVPSAGQLHLALAFPAPSGEAGALPSPSLSLSFPLTHTLSFSLSLAAGKPYSVLAALLAAQGLKAFLQPYSSGGLLGIYSTDPAQLQSLASALQSIASSSAPVARLQAVRTTVALSRLLALEGPGEGSTALLLEAYLAGLPADQLADLRSVSEESVRQAAAAVLASAPSLAVLGPSHRAPSYAAVAKLFA